jgi:hypothetical protein
MPYIPKDRRESLADDPNMQTAGELNFALTCCIKAYLGRHGLSYQSINDVTGALVNAQAEFYRRVAVPYEHLKMSTNGDVYDDLI